MNNQELTVIMKLIEENKNAYLLNNDNLIQCMKQQKKLYEKMLKKHVDNNNDDEDDDDFKPYHFKFGIKKQPKKST